MPLEPHAFKNDILAHLPSSELALLGDHLNHVMLETGNLLYKGGDRIERLFFVESGVVSASIIEGEKRFQIGMVGSDGVVGCAAINSPVAVSYWQIEVLIRGEAWMVPTAAFHTCLDQAPALRERVLEQAHILVGQIAQTSFCNNQHSVDQRLARWLLITRDKARTDDLALPSELVAKALGLSRIGLQFSLRKFEEKGLVRAGRLRTQILDRYGLEETACRCYEHLREFAGKINPSQSAPNGLHEL